MAKTKGLGKGLNALFGETTSEYELAISEEEKAGAIEIPLSKVFPNINQPRKNFDEESLTELKNSIISHGVINPIVVNKESDGYMIIAGERRFRASIMAGLKNIPAIVLDVSEKKIREISLIENLQREDLNAIETAKGIKELMDRYGLTQEVVADRLSKSRSNVANYIRILSLPNEVITLIESDKLSMGHAKVLAGIGNDKEIIKLANAVVEKKLSVRDLEKLVQKLNQPKEKKEKEVQSDELKDIIEKMQVVFGTRVKAVGNDNKGRIVIDYFTRDDLERINEIIFKTK